MRVCSRSDGAGRRTGAWALASRTLAAGIVALTFGATGGDGPAGAAVGEQWVLVDTTENPAGDAAPDTWAVTLDATSLSVVQSFGPDDPGGGEATFDANWEAPPATLTPGDPLVIPVTVSGRNTGNLDTQYFFGLDVIMIVNGRWNDQAVGAGANCAQTTVISGEYVCSDPVTNSGEMTTTVPTFGDEFSVGLGALNCGGACYVEWTYEFVAPDSTPVTSVDEPSVAVPVGEEWGVIEEDGVLKLIPPPDGGVLSISRDDLPEWARWQVVTAGALVANVGPPDSVLQGDPRVLVDGAPVARVGDGTSHGGVITDGSDRILVDGQQAAIVGGLTTCPMVTGVVPHVGGPILTPGSGDAYLSLTDPVYRSARLTIDAVDKFQAYLDEWGTDNPNNLPHAARQLQQDLEFARTVADARSGDTRLQGDFEGYEVGDGVVIGGEQTDVGVVAEKGSIILDEPLLHDHPAGSPTIRIDAQLAADARAAGAAGTNPVGDTVNPVLVVLVVAAALTGGALVLRGRRRATPVDP